MGAGKLLAEWFWIDRWMGSSGFLLPMEPRGLYREMLTQAWRRGAALPNDHEAIRRATGCSDEEWERCWPKIAKFWKVAPGGLELVNETQMEVYADALGIKMRAQARAQAGAQAMLKRKLKPKPPNSDSDITSSLRSDVTPLPLTGSVSVTAGWLVDLWAELNPSLPQPRQPVNGSVLKALRAAATRDPDPDVWRDRFSRVAASAWLTGQTGNFRASILWATGPKNTAKIDAGQYENHEAAKQSRTETLYREAAELLERSRHVQPADETLPLGYDDAAAS